MAKDNLVSTTKDYYDSKDADEFYHAIWGGEDIHVGIYRSDGEDIATASRRSVDNMLEMLPEITPDTRILDMGAGYGGAARHLAQRYGCTVHCLNLSETENERNREKTREAGLDDKVEVTGGNFEEMPYPENHYDIIWCQDSILHSGEKFKVFQEVERVLKPGGHFIFTDPMQSDDCPDGVLDSILKRIHLGEMGSVKKYREFAEKVGLREKEIREMPEQLVNHYGRVQEELAENKTKLEQVCSDEYLTRMHAGLTDWVEGGKKGYLNWGILQFTKP